MRLSPTSLRWLWLLAGVALLPFTAYQGVIAPAAWLAPMFLLRFVRTAGRGGPALCLVFAAYVGAALVGGRGTNATGIDLIWGVVGSIIHGLLLTFAYAADRLLGRRLTMWPRLFVFPTAFVWSTGCRRSSTRPGRSARPPTRSTATCR